MIVLNRGLIRAKKKVMHTTLRSALVPFSIGDDYSEYQKGGPLGNSLKGNVTGERGEWGWKWGEFIMMASFQQLVFS